MKGSCCIALLLLLGLAGGAPLGAEPPESERGSSERVSIDIRDASVLDVLVSYSQKLGLNFVVADEAVSQKRITIYAPQPVSVDDARRMLFAALQVNGMNVELDGAYVKVSVKE